VAEIRAKLAPGTPVEVWFQDEMRVGQKNKLTYRWARKGSRPRAAHDQRTQSTYLFGAVCPERGAGAALVLPACNCEAMQLHLDEIATRVAPGAHAILLLDQAGWHGAKALVIPSNVSLVPLPPRAPELNGQENIWQFMRQNWLSNRIFKSFDDIVDHCCYAWNTLIGQPWKIMSIARRDWAAVGHSIGGLVFNVNRIRYVLVSSWNVRATPLFREGSASPKMIRTGRLNFLSLGIICVRDRTVGNKSSFRRKKAGRALGVASNC
jgi:putative transposase